MTNNPLNIGILALEAYTPRTYVAQAELEAHMGVPPGKFTIGLGQEGLALTGDAEDINSICLTVVHSLLEKYNIDPMSVGRIEVGTETLTDKSKSTKTVLMDLFVGNSDVEGATIVNACYGGTAALLNALAWCNLDERYAIVVAADIATYAAGPARPTCGVGAVAVLVGRDAPLVVGERATHAAHVWDFFKPNPATEYPVVHGALSQTCYYQALEDVYERWSQKTNYTATSPDYWVFHAPYNKLVQKSYARLFYMDALLKSSGEFNEWLQMDRAETYMDKSLEKALKDHSASAYAQKLTDANYASQQVGNTYTASVFLGLCSLISRKELTADQLIAVFSYGSGALATLYALHVRTPVQTRFTTARMRQQLQLDERLAMREKVSANELDLALDTRAAMHRGGVPYTPIYPSNRLFPGTYYLTHIDATWRRCYQRTPLEPMTPWDGVVRSLKPAAVIKSFSEETDPSACYITGIAAGLPGQEEVFRHDNIERLLNGENCISPVTVQVQQSMLDKNIVLLKKNPDKTAQKIPLTTTTDMIQLAAQLGNFDLTERYGVPVGLAKTMDVAAQVAVAAGLEALKSAGLVSGASSDPAEWKLPTALQADTGVVYASSFPAMDAAIGEVMRYFSVSSQADSLQLIRALRQRVLDTKGTLSPEDEDALSHLKQQAVSINTPSSYAFDRKFLFRVLVLGNAQLAQLTGCKGPNTQTNAACAGTTQAISMAQDMLVSGRAARVVVIAGDNAAGPTLLPWLGSGFRVLGAATCKPTVEEAALPFDKRRSGMLLGAGGIGLVLETAASIRLRQLTVTPSVRLLATQYSNSAFHGAALDRHHIGSELVRFLDDIEKRFGITKSQIAEEGVYFSHETCTHASDASSCAGNEVAALRQAFGDDLSKLLIVNTKGYTGHPMGVSFEDVTAVAVLDHQRVPAIPHHQVHDEYLGALKLSQGGSYSCKFALRFAAGFGSQVAFALYAKV